MLLTSGWRGPAAYAEFCTAVAADFLPAETDKLKAMAAFADKDPDVLGLMGFTVVNIFPGLNPNALTAICDGFAAVVYMNFGVSSGLPNNLLEAVAIIKKQGTAQFVLTGNIAETTGETQFSNQPDIDTKAAGVVSFQTINQSNLEELVTSLDRYVANGLRGEGLENALITQFAPDQNWQAPDSASRRSSSAERIFDEVGATDYQVTYLDNMVDQPNSDATGRGIAN